MLVGVAKGDCVAQSDGEVSVVVACHQYTVAPVPESHVDHPLNSSIEAVVH